MRRLPVAVVLPVLLLTVACAPVDPAEVIARDYLTPSRFTDPGHRSAILDELPDDVTGIAGTAQGLTVHHNLLPYHEGPREAWAEMTRPWPPKMPDLLSALEDTGPGNLTDRRRIEDRLVGARMLESHLLGGMLRHREILVRKGARHRVPDLLRSEQG